MVKLGPMSHKVRAMVSRLVAEARPKEPGADERLSGFLLTGGPSGCSFLDADGEVWNWCVWDDSVERVPDGPTKVGLVATATERVPELAEWLPQRPTDAGDCERCASTGWLQPPWPRLQCPDCNGLGWVAPAR